MGLKEKKKIVYSFVFTIIGVVFLKLAFDYTQSKIVYGTTFKGKVVSFGKSRDTELPYASLSDDSRVYLGSYFPQGNNPEKGDTLIKHQESFKLYLKREGRVVDSFKHIYSDNFISRLFF